jgi:hypothetical protein
MKNDECSNFHLSSGQTLPPDQNAFDEARRRFEKISANSVTAGFYRTEKSGYEKLFL